MKNCGTNQCNGCRRQLGFLKGDISVKVGRILLQKIFLYFFMNLWVKLENQSKFFCQDVQPACRGGSHWYSAKPFPKTCEKLASRLLNMTANHLCTWTVHPCFPAVEKNWSLRKRDLQNPWYSSPLSNHWVLFFCWMLRISLKQVI